MIWKDRVKLRLMQRKSKRVSYTNKNQQINQEKLCESRRTFYNSIKHLNNLEKDSITAYLKNFIDKNPKEGRSRCVRTMSVGQKDQLTQYIRKHSPDLKNVNLSDLEHTSRIFPQSWYKTSTKYQETNFLNKTSVVWDMYGQSNLNSSEKKKLMLLSKMHKKVTDYSLTKTFLSKVDVHIGSKETINQGEDSFEESFKQQRNLRTIEYDFNTIVAHFSINNLSLISTCHSFAFGHRIVIILSTETAFYCADLYCNFYLYR